MASSTYVCWRSSGPSDGWTIYQVDEQGRSAALASFKNYLDAARTLRQLRNANPGGQAEILSP